MSEKEARNPPFGLDMPYAEALERFIGTDRQEALGAEGIETPTNRKGMPNVLTWEKKLSTTDAQQQTSGGLVPYLRLTSGNLSSASFQTWFRQTFFANCTWQAGQFNNKPVEEAHVPFTVSVQGIQLGTVLFKATHDGTRQDSHNAPNTWLHWPPQMEAVLQNNNFANCPLVLTRDASGAFSMEIQ
ncbi:hypothetical protein [Novosphingobium sp.]|uniref:hypothetical protein n=1 Tax=Novosphingobium sp. TaxID=1874826 RepID=UPI0027369D0F|nr:hypothetical protein [Novosphingobium sp.]MDP3908598.1 hypothetical protein [Novosphingobium sp.]